MMTQSKPHQCLSCLQTEQEIPLVVLQYRGSPAWICSQCLPLLIHHPEDLIGKLANADRIAPSAQQDD